MSDLVRARVGAVKDLAYGLTTYERGLNGAVASARSDLNGASAEFTLAVVRAQTEFDRARQAVDGAQAALGRCQENCEPLQRQLAQARVSCDIAERRWQTNKQAQARFERAATDLLSSIGTIASASQQAIPSARGQIQSYASDLSDYLARSAS